MMKYGYFSLGAIVVLWMVWLCIRSFTPRVPEQRRRYYTVHPATMIFVLGMFCILQWVGCVCAATGGVGLWFVAVAILVFVVGYLWLLDKSISCNVAFSDELIAVRDAFGPIHIYRWEDVTAYSVRKEMLRGKVYHEYDLYTLTMPDRVIRISGAEDAGRELLQVFERKRPDMKAVRVQGKK